VTDLESNLELVEDLLIGWAQTITDRVDILNFRTVADDPEAGRLVNWYVAAHKREGRQGKRRSQTGALLQRPGKRMGQPLCEGEGRAIE
jgi:hypothetical protein